MPFNFALTKAKCRQAVHDVLGVPAIYKINTASAPQNITARWHEKKVLQGQIEGEGSQVWEGIDHVVFNTPQLQARNITPKRGNVVTFLDYQGFTVTLDYKLTTDGPVEEVWAVLRDTQPCQL